MLVGIAGNLRGGRGMRKFLERLVAWMQRKMYEDTISEKEATRMLREIEKLLEKNKVK